MSSRMQVVIIDRDHPHEGCRGYVEVSDRDTVTVHTLFGREMVLVQLEDCKHAGTACYVPKVDGRPALTLDRRRRH